MPQLPAPPHRRLAEASQPATPAGLSFDAFEKRGRGRGGCIGRIASQADFGNAMFRGLLMPADTVLAEEALGTVSHRSQPIPVERRHSPATDERAIPSSSLP